MIRVHWFLPTAGDSRDVVASGDDGHRRPPTLGYLAQVAAAAEQLGFDSVLTPTGTDVMRCPPADLEVPAGATAVHLDLACDTGRR